MNFSMSTTNYDTFKTSPSVASLTNPSLLISASKAYSTSSSNSSLSSSPSTHQALVGSQPIDILNCHNRHYSDETFSQNLSSNQNDDYSDSSMSEDFDVPQNGEHTTTSNNNNNSNEINTNIKMEMDDSTMRTNGVNSSGNTSVNSTSRVNRFFPDKVVDVLNKWFFENQEYPYPDDNMTNFLAKEANISAKQVRKWFANKRVRSNKCFKQTCRTKKDRRQTRSIGDEEMYNLMMNNEETHQYEQDELEGQVNYTLNNINLKKEKKHTKQFQQQQQILQSKPKSSSSSYSLSSSSSSSTSSSYYSPSSYGNQYEENASFYANTAYRNQDLHRSTSAQSAQEFLYNLSFWKNQLNKTNGLINTQQRQASLNDLTNASLLCNSNTNSTATTSTNNDESPTASSVNNSAVVTAAAVAATAAAAAAAAAAVNHHQLQYNPQYLLINLIQNNPTMAFQAAITNRLLNLSNQSQQHINTHESPSTTVKRKTHLSKCFMNDLNQNIDDSLLTKRRNSPEINRSSLTSSPSTSTTSSALSSPSSNSATSRRSSNSEVNLHYCHNYQYESQEQNLLSTKPKSTVRKINFGDISDLIN